MCRFFCVYQENVVPLHSLTLRLVTTRGAAAQWKLALRYALPIANSRGLVYSGYPKQNDQI